MITHTLTGMPGEPLPYLLHTDWLVTSILFACIMLASFTLSKEKKYLLQQLNTSLKSRKRSSMFDETSVSNTYYKYLLILHAYVLLGLCVYYYYTKNTPDLFTKH